MNQQSLRDRFYSDGFISPITIFDTDTALYHRQFLENTEAKLGPMHYKSKIYTMLRSPYEIVTSPKVLDVVEQLIGPDILLYNATYIIKELHTLSHVSWHQDLTYWGFDSDDQVSMWLALSPASTSSGCMMMIPGSHVQGRKEHIVTDDKTNVLYSGQTVYGVNEDKAVACPLESGQASFHHGWTLHCSMPNNSEDRRIGLNVQYLAPHVRQTKHDKDSAMLVRGVDRYQHFEADIPAEKADLTPEGIARQKILEERHKEIAANQ